MKQGFVDRGGITSLSNILSSPSARVVEGVLATLSVLAATPQYRNRIIESAIPAKLPAILDPTGNQVIVENAIDFTIQLLTDGKNFRLIWKIRGPFSHQVELK